jgi:hypothetical protein
MTSIAKSSSATSLAAGGARSASTQPSVKKAPSADDSLDISLSALDVVLGGLKVSLHYEQLPSGAQSTPAAHAWAGSTSSNAKLELFYDHFRLSPPCAIQHAASTLQHKWSQIVYIGGNEARTLLKLPLELRLYSSVADDSHGVGLLGLVGMDIIHDMWADSAVDGSRSPSSHIFSTTLHDMVAVQAASLSSSDVASMATNIPFNARITVQVVWKPAQIGL